MAADDAPPPAGGGSFLTRKIGPLPAWAYAAIAGVGAFFWIRHSSSTDTTADTSTDDPDADTTDAEDSDDSTDDGDDYPPPPDTTNVPYPPPINITVPPSIGPAGNTGRKLRVVSVTKADDTVPKLLARYGMSLAQLRKDNPGRTWKAKEKLKPGDKVHVPVKA